MLDLTPFEQVLVAGGIAAPLVYVITVAAGAAIRPGYGHIANAVSELVGSGAPNRAALNLAFAAYNALVVAFGLGLAAAFAGIARGAEAAGYFMAATGFIGMAMNWFPMDPVGAKATRRGIVHIVLAGFLSLGTLAAILAFSIGAGGLDDWGGVATYSYVTFGVTLATGGLAALSAARAWSTMGLMERLTIGFGLQWMALVAFVVLDRA